MNVSLRPNVFKNLATSFFTLVHWVLRLCRFLKAWRLYCSGKALIYEQTKCSRILQSIYVRGKGLARLDHPSCTVFAKYYVNGMCKYWLQFNFGLYGVAYHVLRPWNDWDLFEVSFDKTIFSINEDDFSGWETWLYFCLFNISIN